MKMSEKPTYEELEQRIRKLEQAGIVFETSGEDPGLTTGDEVRLKFRLPLFHKSHYFDIKAQITEMVHSATGAFVTTNFSQIAEEDQASISQFVKDMQFLRRQARGSVDFDGSSAPEDLAP